ncbi:hypothetical protein FOA52_008763 [Chlamydomonas sp. UWO 241]|nr:hypothetical protein FOA52_008763 [Chlamydomonas sp. UWO 241]
MPGAGSSSSSSSSNSSTRRSSSSSSTRRSSSSSRRSWCTQRCSAPTLLDGEAAQASSKAPSTLSTKAVAITSRAPTKHTRVTRTHYTLVAHSTGAEGTTKGMAGEEEEEQDTSIGGKLHLMRGCLCTRRFPSPAALQLQTTEPRYLSAITSTAMRPEPALSAQRLSYRAERHLGPGASASPLGNGFRIMSYNILADTYAFEHAANLYRSTPHFCLAWAYRLPRLVHEVSVWKPAVICLQEVDRFDDLALGLGQLGYVGEFLQRSGGRQDGCATFWDPKLFARLGVDNVMMHEHGLKDNVALLVALRPLGPVCEPGAASEEQQQQQGQQQGQQHGQQQQQGQQQGQHQEQQQVHAQGRVGVVAQQVAVQQSQQQQHVQQQQGQGQQPQRQRSGRKRGGGAGGSGTPGGMGDAPSELGGSGAQPSSAPLPSNTCLVVGNTHVLFNTKRGDVKLGQLRTMLSRMHAMGGAVALQGGPAACVLMGDFNTAPGSGVYSFVETGSLVFGGLPRDTLSGQIEGYGFENFLRDAQNGIARLSPYRSASRANLLALQAQAQAEQQAQKLALVQAQQAQEAGQARDQWEGPYHASAYVPWEAAAAQGQAQGQQAQGPALGQQQAQQQQGQQSLQAQQAAIPASPATPLPHTQQQQSQWHTPAPRESPMSSSATPMSSSHSYGRTPRSHGRHHGGTPQSLAALRWDYEALRHALGSDEAVAAAFAAELAAGGHTPSGRQQQQPQQAGGRSPPPADALSVRHPIGVASAYHTVCGCEPLFTTSHSRYIGTVDYMWYTPHATPATAGNNGGAAGDVAGAHNSALTGTLALLPTSALLPPDAHRLPYGLPSPVWPSDHVSLVADFQFFSTGADS